MAMQFERAPPTGLSVLVVGGGIAGLCLAIDAVRKGHSVWVLERRGGLGPYGDGIGIQCSALHTPHKWPGFMERARAVAYPPILHIRKYDGAFYADQEFGLPGNLGMLINRCDLHQVLYDYAVDVGIVVEFGVDVVEYRETDTSGIAVLSDGQPVEADLVVAADGVGSKSWRLVTGQKQEAISSGFAMYRVTYPAAPAMENPITAKEFEGQKTYFALLFGSDLHMVYGKTEQTIFWAMMHLDDGSAEEDWTKPVSVENALPWVKDWTPVTTELVKATPNGTCTDFKIMWRNP